MEYINPALDSKPSLAAANGGDRSAGDPWFVVTPSGRRGIVAPDCGRQSASTASDARVQFIGRKHPSKLPTVLSAGEVRTLLASIRHPVRRMALTTIYALGLRLGEGLRL